MIFLALMIICMIYSVSIYMVGSGTFSFVIWIVGAAFFGISFFLAGNGRWLKVPIALRALSYGLIALVLVALIICSVAMASHFEDKGEKDLEMEELFDITDENGFVTGQTVTRSEAHDKGIMHRTAHIWIVRKKGDSCQVLLQKRSAEKESFPSMYDTSSAGSIPVAGSKREAVMLLSDCRQIQGLYFFGDTRGVLEPLTLLFTPQ